MSKTGGGRGTNQYAVKGTSRVRAQDPGVLDDLAEDSVPAEYSIGRVRAGCVEVGLSPGIPSFTVHGISSWRLVAARDRVRAAMLSSDMTWPQRRIAVQTSQNHLSDLALSAGLLEASGQVPEGACEGREFIGELGLDGKVKKMWSAAEQQIAETSDATVLYVARDSQVTGRPGQQVVHVEDLRELREHLRASRQPAGSDLSHLEPDALRERIAALAPLAQYGSDYNRGVAEALGDARRRITTSTSYPPDLAAAHAAVMEAEVAARRRSIDDIAAYRNGGWAADVALLRQRSEHKTPA